MTKITTNESMIQRTLEDVLIKKNVQGKVETYQMGEVLDRTTKEVVLVLSETVIDATFHSSIESSFNSLIVSVFADKNQRIADIVFSVTAEESSENTQNFRLQQCYVTIYEQAIENIRTEVLAKREKAGLTLLLNKNPYSSIMTDTYLEEMSRGKSLVYSEDSFIEINSYRDEKRAWIVFLTTNPKEEAVFTKNRKATQRIEHILNESKKEPVIVCGDEELQERFYPYATKIIVEKTKSSVIEEMDDIWLLESEKNGWKTYKRIRSEFK